MSFLRKQESSSLVPLKASHPANRAVGRPLDSLGRGDLFHPAKMLRKHFPPPGASTFRQRHLSPSKARCSRCVSVKFVGNGFIGGGCQTDSQQVAPFHWKIDKPVKMQGIVHPSMPLQRCLSPGKWINLLLQTSWYQNNFPIHNQDAHTFQAGSADLPPPPSPLPWGKRLLCHSCESRNPEHTSPLAGEAVQSGDTAEGQEGAASENANIPAAHIW